jgi:hypothetical protein
MFFPVKLGVVRRDVDATLQDSHDSLDAKEAYLQAQLDGIKTLAVRSQPGFSTSAAGPRSGTQAAQQAAAAASAPEDEEDAEDLEHAEEDEDDDEHDAADVEQGDDSAEDY